MKQLGNTSWKSTSLIWRDIRLILLSNHLIQILLTKSSSGSRQLSWSIRMVSSMSRSICSSRTTTSKSLRSVDTLSASMASKTISARVMTSMPSNRLETQQSSLKSKYRSRRRCSKRTFTNWINGVLTRSRSAAPLWLPFVPRKVSLESTEELDLILWSRSTGGSRA